MSQYGGKVDNGEIIASVISMYSKIIEDRIHTRYTTYIEPFCGMLGVYRHIHVFI